MKRIIVALGLLVTLLVASGCSVIERFGQGISDPRPRSSIGALVDEIRTLPGITSATETSPGTVEADLRTDASADELGDTAGELFDLVNDFRYPGGTPAVTATSGKFTASVPESLPNTLYDPPPTAPALSALPYLHTLPDVASGHLPGGWGMLGGMHPGPLRPSSRIVLELDPGTDMAAWTESVAARTRPYELDVHRPRTADEPADPTPQDLRGEMDRPSAIEYVLDLADPGTLPVLRDTHSALTGTDQLLTRAEISPSRRDTALSIQVPAPTDIVPAFEHLENELGPIGYGEGTEVDMITDDGLATSEPDEGFEDLFVVIEPIVERGGTVTGLGGDGTAAGSTVSVGVPDADALRRIVDYAASEAWPLSPDTTLKIGTDPHWSTSATAVAQWPAQVPLLAALWEAGWDASTVDDLRGLSGDGTPSTFDLGITVAARDRTTAHTRAEREEIVRLLRQRDWDGTASIRISIDDDELRFHSTADGVATDLSYEKYSEQPARWEKDFIALWDATAG
ncbi:hypothetical protein MTQ12_09750 [Brevibacterium sp. R8603A2]|uniref:hypothetical protein n=1 Tax=Brevibacterium sp. R8603A2 TaxID=2929779 RepID=UPI001FF918BA|nr:hypothetical protein [Brevibacterium sp. R8603A2]MCK1803324.1 hypothetical protein [Brevibacterium sp. R8603A2]